MFFFYFSFLSLLTVNFSSSFYQFFWFSFSPFSSSIHVNSIFFWIFSLFLLLMALFMGIELYFSIFLGIIHNEFFSTFLSSWTVYILCCSFVILHYFYYTCGCYNFFPLFTLSVQFLFALFTSTIHFFFFSFFFCKPKRLGCCSIFFLFYFTIDVNIIYFYIFHL